MDARRIMKLHPAKQLKAIQGLVDDAGSGIVALKKENASLKGQITKLKKA